MNEEIRLFRFLSAEAALKTIRHRSFKVGRIAEFNDPFEWRVGVSGVLLEHHDRVRAAQQEIVDTLGKDVGVVCFCDICTHPILWSHYADHHKGIAFEVEYAASPSLLKVEYSDSRPAVDVRRLLAHSDNREYLEPIVRKVYVRKSVSWSYEREYRVLVDLKVCTVRDSMFFVPIPEDFLKRVILGFRCELKEIQVREMLAASGLSDVEVVRAKECCEQYAVLC